MCVIFGASDDQGLEAVFSGNAAYVGPEIGLNLQGNDFVAILRRENAMHETGNIGV